MMLVLILEKSTWLLLFFLAYLLLRSPSPHPKYFAHGMQASCIPQLSSGHSHKARKILLTKTPSRSHFPERPNLQYGI